MRIVYNGQASIFGSIKIQQYNNMVDTVVLTIPQVYGGIDMADATARIVVDGCPTLIDGVSDDISKEVSDALIRVTWTVGRDYTEAAGIHEGQLSLLDAQERALYTRKFTIEVMPSIPPGEWDGNTQMWDDYLAQFTALSQHADEVEAELSEFDDTYEEKLQAITDAGDDALDDISEAGRDAVAAVENKGDAAMAAIQRKIDDVGWTINAAGNVEVTIGGNA